MMGGSVFPASGETAAPGPGENVAAGSTRQAPKMPRPHLTTERQIAYWRRSGLLRPGATELAQARTISALRRSGISLARIRAAADRLATSWTALHGHDTLVGAVAGGSPLPADPESTAAGLPRFAVVGGELFIRHPDGTWEGDRRPGQLILDGVLPLPGCAPADVTAAEMKSGPDRASATLGPAGPSATRPDRVAGPSATRPDGVASGDVPRRNRVPGLDRDAILRFLAREDTHASPRPRTPSS